MLSTWPAHVLTVLPCAAATITSPQGFNIPSEGMWFWFEGMIDLFFYIDLVLNFFTAYEVSVRHVMPQPGCVQQGHVRSHRE